MNVLLLLLTLSAAPLTDGEFWVPRRDRQGISRGDGRTTESHWTLECERVEVKGRLLTLGEFTFNHRDGKIYSPMFSSPYRHVPLSGACLDTFPETPRFATLEECSKSRGPLTITCDGGDCHASVPFVAFPNCDVEMRAITQLAELALSVEHDDAVKTLERVNVLTKKGGKLWQRGGCEVVTLKAGKGGLTTLHGPDWEAEGTLEPVFGQARLQATRTWATDGSLGMSGSSAQTEPLLLGKSLLILGRRVLFTDEAACVAESKKL